MDGHLFNFDQTLGVISRRINSIGDRAALCTQASVTERPVALPPGTSATQGERPWAPFITSENLSILRLPTPCARRSTALGKTWKRQATFLVQSSPLTGRAKRSPCASLPWCNAASAIRTISAMMRSTILLDEPHHTRDKALPAHRDRPAQPVTAEKGPAGRLVFQSLSGPRETPDRPRAFVSSLEQGQ